MIAVVILGYPAVHHRRRPWQNAQAISISKGRSFVFGSRRHPVSARIRTREGSFPFASRSGPRVLEAQHPSLRGKTGRVMRSIEHRDLRSRLSHPSQPLPHPDMSHNQRRLPSLSTRCVKRCNVVDIRLPMTDVSRTG